MMVSIFDPTKSSLFIFCSTIAYVIKKLLLDLFLYDFLNRNATKHNNYEDIHL